MKAVVIGGAGFIGSNLVDRLIGDQYETIVVDNLSTGKASNINRDATFIQMDISEDNSVGSLQELMEGAEFVFHLAALARVQPSIIDPVAFNKNNTNGTLNVLWAAHNARVGRVIYSASSSAYGDSRILPTPETHPINPLSPYGLQKYIGEEYCKMFSEVYGLDTVSLRYFNVYGERMLLEGGYCLVMGIFAQQMLEGKPLTITNDGKQRRDFTYVGDVCEANILAAHYKDNLRGEAFNIGNGNNFSVNEVVDMFGGEKRYGEKRLEPYETLADNSKAREILGWKPQGNLGRWIKEYKESLGL